MSLVTNRFSTAALFAVAIAAAMSAAGCSKDASSAVPGAADAGGSRGSSYELVTVTKPASVEDFFAVYRALHATCTVVAELKKLPFKPFPTPPADFVHIRTTYISDGKSFYRKDVAYSVDLSKNELDHMCEVSIASETSTTVAHNGTRIENGQEDEEPWPGPVDLDPKELVAYIVPKTVNGIALKCVSPDHPFIKANLAIDGCILDPKLGKFATPFAKPIDAYFRTDIAGATETIVEPVSLKIGARVDPSLFSLAGPK